MAMPGHCDGNSAKLVRSCGQRIPIDLNWTEGHPETMSRALVNRVCADLPGAVWSDPWGGGHDAWKVGGKLFAVVGAVEGNGLSVKCADIETATLLIDLGRGFRARYFHASWLRIPFGHVPEEEMTERIRISYAVIRGSLTRKAQAALGPF